MPSTHSVGELLDAASDSATVKMGIKVLKENDLAMAYLLLAFNSARRMRMIRGAKTTAYPYGLADLVFKALERYYTPRDMTSRVELNIRKTKVSMEPNEHPKVLFEQMSELEEEFGVTFGLEDQIPILIGAAPAVYHLTIVQEQRSKTNALTVDNLEDCMMDLYWTTYGMKNAELKEEYEMGMTGMSGIICNYCNKPGHKMTDCYSWKNEQERNGNTGSTGKFNGTCNQCGKMGHRKNIAGIKNTTCPNLLHGGRRRVKWEVQPSAPPMMTELST